MKKVLFVSTGLSMGGAEVMLYNLLSKMDRSRFQPIVVSLMGNDDDVYKARISDLGIDIHSLNLDQGKFSLNKLFQLSNLIKQEQPDVLQGWMYHGNIATQLAGLFAFQKIPVIWSIHHSLHSLSSEKSLTQIIIRVGAFLSKVVNKVAYVSEKSLEQHQKLGYPEHNSCYIPNGFNTKLFKPSSEFRESFRNQLNISQDSILIGSLARYHPMKDHENLLRAAQIFLKDFPEANFVLLGTNVDYENKVLSDLIEELGIASQVHLLGARTDVPQVLPALDILTSSSAFGEAFPLVIGEAMSCGVPCVVTNIGDSAAIVGDTGVVVPPKNPQELADGWKKICQLSSEEKSSLSQRTRQKVLDLYSLESVVGKYEALYENI